MQGRGDQQRLLVGTQDDGAAADLGVRAPHPAGVGAGPGRGVDRRRAPRSSGSRPTGGPASRQRCSIPSAAGGGRVVALRLSPDGSRVALVVAGANGAAAALRRADRAQRAGRSQVDGLQQVSPDGVVIDDVAWVDSLKLFAIGYLRGSQDAGVFETAIDGSQWDDLGISTLPKPPTSITATTDAPAWVSADGFVWKQNGSNWVSPGAEPNGQTPGEKPVYLG